MNCELPPEVREYIEAVERDEPRACKWQHALAAYVRRVFATEDIHVDTDKLAHYLSLAKYFPYEELFPWEKFIEALWLCTYRADGFPRWKTCFCMVGRGAGKDGLIAHTSFCQVSPYNRVPRYDVDICANNEDQAMRPMKDVLEVLEGAKEKKLNRFFFHTKELVQGRKNLGVIKGRTNNPKGKDGLRSGCVIFNEVHAYENYANITVFKTGLGKKAEPREGIFTSNGEVSDGPLDDYLERADRILFENEPDDGFLPFVCRLEAVEQVHEPENWTMANPSLPYLPTLRQEIEDEYRGWLQRPEENIAFIIKRMGIRVGAKEISVTDYEKVLLTKKPIPDLSGKPCTVGIDYAELSDWAAVNLHFRIGNDRCDINHAWVCAQSKTLSRIRAPWREWAAAGHLTVVDDVSISPTLLAEYIAEAGRKYKIKMLGLDNFRWTLISDAMRKIGFDAKDKSRVKLIRPSDIMTVEPVIQECFDRELFHWGDCPPLRWAVNNTKRVRSSRKIGSDTGNFYYAKIEAKSRKTDPFMALVHSMCCEPVLGNGEPVTMPKIGAISI